MAAQKPAAHKPEDSARLRVPDRLVQFMLGTQLGQDMNHGNGEPDPAQHSPDRIAMFRKVFDTKPRRSDHDARHVNGLTERDLELLYDMADTLEMVSRDNVAEMDALADLNAARAVLTRLARIDRDRRMG